jgi:hypothetical protein
MSSYRVFRHLLRPVARRARVNANVVDAPLGLVTLSDLCHVFAIAKVWQASLCNRH